jgi:hypothetical protein
MKYKLELFINIYFIIIIRFYLIELYIRFKIITNNIDKIKEFLFTKFNTIYVFNFILFSSYIRVLNWLNRLLLFNFFYSIKNIYLAFRNKININLINRIYLLIGIFNILIPSIKLTFNMSFINIFLEFSKVNL